MKKIILSLAFAGSVLLAASACNSTKSVSGSTDSGVVDTAVNMTPAQPMDQDTTRRDTGKTMPPDTTRIPMN